MAFKKAAPTTSLDLQALSFGYDAYLLEGIHLYNGAEPDFLLRRFRLTHHSRMLRIIGMVGIIRMSVLLRITFILCITCIILMWR